MRKLLRANFSRLFRDKLFLVSLALMFVMGTALQIMHCIDNVKNNENWTPDATCFVFAVFVPILLSLITALFIGSDYSDGTMRNKLIVGHKRHCIYLANLIVIAAAGILLSISYILPHTVRRISPVWRICHTTECSAFVHGSEFRAYGSILVVVRAYLNAQPKQSEHHCRMHTSCVCAVVRRSVSYLCAE